jgi:hypothetical protein
LVGGSIDLSVNVYHRSGLSGRRGPSKWNYFVKSHPAGSWWHTEEWLDYCLDYDANAVDLSFALVNDSKPERLIVLAICPAIKTNNTIRMGHDACAGPLAFENTHVDLLCNEISKRLSGCDVEWRWNRYPFDYRNMIVRFSECIEEPRHLSWNTAMVSLNAPLNGLTSEAYERFNYGAVVSSAGRRWRNIRKSYRSLIRRTEEQYSFLASRPNTSSPHWSLWNHYVACHKACATKPRSDASYRHQLSWIKKGFGDILIAFPKGGLDHSAGELPGRVTSSLPRTSTDGSSPSPSTTTAAAYVINYKGHHYYASGPSLEKNVQHALQWRVIQYLAHRGLDGLDYGQSYELGWVDKVQNDPIGFFKSGFGGELHGVDCVTGRIAQAQQVESL